MATPNVNSESGSNGAQDPHEKQDQMINKLWEMTLLTMDTTERTSEPNAVKDAAKASRYTA